MPQPESTRLKNIRAVIVKYSDDYGVLVVQHHTSPSLEATVESYLRNCKKKKDSFAKFKPECKEEKVWFAKFRWKCIDLGDRKRIQSLGKKRKSREISISKVLRGMAAVCTLVKNPKWEAVQISIDFSHARFELPGDVSETVRRTRSSGPKERKGWKNTTAGRVARASGRTNLGRPWRG